MLDQTREIDLLTFTRREAFPKMPLIQASTGKQCSKGQVFYSVSLKDTAFINFYMFAPTMINTAGLSALDNVFFT